LVYDYQFTSFIRTLTDTEDQPHSFAMTTISPKVTEAVITPFKN